MLSYRRISEIKVPCCRSTPDLPETLKLADLILELQGNLQKGYHLAGLAQLPNTAEQMQLSVAALIQASGAQLQALRLSASAEAYVALEGSVDWQNDLQADAQLQTAEFPLAQPAWAKRIFLCSCKVLTGQVSYNVGAYKGQIDGDLNGPAGPFSLTSAFAGDLERVQLHDLLIEAGQGRLQGTANVGFADGVQWLADIQASKLNPAYWLEELPGELAGAIHSQGFLRDGQLQVDARADLKANCVAL